jgi:hypothetical protein
MKLFIDDRVRVFVKNNTSLDAVYVPITPSTIAKQIESDDLGDTTRTVWPFAAESGFGNIDSANGGTNLAVRIWNNACLLLAGGLDEETTYAERRNHTRLAAMHYLWLAARSYSDGSAKFNPAAPLLFTQPTSRGLAALCVATMTLLDFNQAQYADISERSVTVHLNTVCVQMEYAYHVMRNDHGRVSAPHELLCLVHYQWLLLCDVYSFYYLTNRYLLKQRNCAGHTEAAGDTHSPTPSQVVFQLSIVCDRIIFFYNGDITPTPADPVTAVGEADASKQLDIQRLVAAANAAREGMYSANADMFKLLYHVLQHHLYNIRAMTNARQSSQYFCAPDIAVALTTRKLQNLFSPPRVTPDFADMPVRFNYAHLHEIEYKDFHAWIRTMLPPPAAAIKRAGGSADKQTQK